VLRTQRAVVEFFTRVVSAVGRDGGMHSVIYVFAFHLRRQRCHCSAGSVAVVIVVGAEHVPSLQKLLKI
jgi:hypothetical protein